MTKTIEIIVSPQGESRVETKGFTGADCQQASKFIEEALGKRTNEQLTAEFHQIASQSQSQLDSFSPKSSVTLAWDGSARASPDSRQVSQSLILK